MLDFRILFCMCAAISSPANPCCRITGGAMQSRPTVARHLLFVAGFRHHRGGARKFGAAFLVAHEGAFALVVVARDWPAAVKLALVAGGVLATFLVLLRDFLRFFVLLGFFGLVDTAFIGFLAAFLNRLLRLGGRLCGGLRLGPGGGASDQHPLVSLAC